MRKYWIVYKSNLQRAFISRMKICTWGFISAFTPMIMLVLYSSYFQAGGLINGYDLKAIIVYYLSVVFISVWVSKSAANIAPDIKEGNLSNFVIKPMDYIFYRIPWEVAWYTISAAFMGLPLVLLLLMGYHDVIIFTLNLFTSHIFLFIPSLVFSYLISYFLSSSIGFMAFFTTETTGFENTYEVILELFSGKLLPLIFFPPFIFPLLKALPFGYIIYFPSQVLTGRLTGVELYTGYAIQLFWVLTTYLLCRFLWNSGVKKFSAIGL